MNAKFQHAAITVLCANTCMNHSEHYYNGHMDEVRPLSICPFVSTSIESTAVVLTFFKHFYSVSERLIAVRKDTNLFHFIHWPHALQAQTLKYVHARI